MKFIAVLNDPKDVEYLSVGMSNEDITLAPITSVARAAFGIFSIAGDNTSPTVQEYRTAAAKLLELAKIRETIEK